MNVLLIDLSSIAHPIWHISASEPDPNATCTKTVARVRALASGQPHVAVCCDSGVSFRKLISPDYKANRPPSDAALQHQIALAIDTLKADGFPVWAEKNFEADDLIASAVGLALLRDDTTVQIASADKDLLQLVSERVTVKSTTSGTEYDCAGVKAKFGVEPAQMRDFLALVGDKSDNVTGAKGIGEKKAAELLEKYGNIEDLYTALTGQGTQFTPAMATNLREFQSRLPVVRELITLRTDVPVPLTEVFRERVPADVAVFGEDEPMSETQINAQSEVQPESGPSRSEGLHSLARNEPLAQNGRSEQSQPAPPAAQAASGQTNGQPAPPSTSLAPRVQPEPDVLAAAPIEWERQLEPRNISQAKLIAADAFGSKLAFGAYGNPAATLMTILSGRELGLQAMASLRAFHIIEGKPTLSADAIRALVIRSGAAEYFRCTERDATHATFVTKRKGEPEMRLTFTVAEGRQAWSKDQKSFDASGWGKNPADMCVARASSKLARLVYPDVTHGLYSPEEMEG